MIKIAVVDDHPIFRAGVIRVLKGEPGFMVVGEGQSADDAVRIASTKRPDVILLDISMPGGGLEAARAIAANAPATNVMMLTVVEDDSFVVAALAAGAKGYVLKGISGPDLVQTIVNDHAGKEGACFVTPGLAARILAQDVIAVSEITPTENVGLSGLDRRILTLMSDGQSHEQIAGIVGLDVAEVRARLSNTLSMLRLLSRHSNAPEVPAKKNMLH